MYDSGENYKKERTRKEEERGRRKEKREEKRGRKEERENTRNATKIIREHIILILIERLENNMGQKYVLRS